MATALITHAACLGHVTPNGHPERIARLEHVLHALQGLDLMLVSAPEVDEAHLAYVHPKAHVAAIKAAIPEDGLQQIDADTWTSPGSWEAGSRAAGAGVKAVDMVMTGEVQNAFCAIRPPGHHAEKTTAMGFCLFGNAAIAAKHALEAHGLQRVAVVDFDVHHGNGTQDLLWDEPRALVTTSQQMPLWPGSGATSERGAHNNVLNVPLPPRSGGTEMRAAYEAQVFPRLSDFKPE